jgi:hypothetical protein
LEKIIDIVNMAVTKRYEAEIAKEVYFETKLASFERKLNTAYANLKALMPCQAVGDK